MSITINTNHGLEKTEAITNYVNKRLTKVIEKFHLQNAKLTVELEKTNNHHNKGEIYKSSVSITGVNNDIFVSEIAEELYVSIDKIENKLNNQLSMNKDKKNTVRHRIGRMVKGLLKRE